MSDTTRDDGPQGDTLRERIVATVGRHSPNVFTRLNQQSRSHLFDAIEELVRGEVARESTWWLSHYHDEDAIRARL